MATIEVKVPSVGESVSEGILSRWMKPDGAHVAKGEPIFELETDKASQEILAEASGALKRRVSEGDTVVVGQVVAELDSASAGTPATSAASSSSAASSASVAAGSRSESAAAAASAAVAVAAPPRDVEVSSPPSSPSARRVAAEHDVDLAAVAASGPRGHVIKSDVLSHIQQPPAPAAAPRSLEPAPSPPAAPPVAPVSRAQAQGRAETRQRMSGIRQKIAQRLVEAQHTAAILTTFNEADMTEIMALRARYKESFQKKHGVGLGFMSFFVKAAIDALKAFPNVNSRIEGVELVTPNYYDIGVAVSTDRGLMVPVLRDAENLSFAGIEIQIAAYAQKARDNKIGVDDLQGGSFTITNGGVFGSLLSTPILNPPQSGILGMHKIQQRPVVIDGQIVARPMMYLALSYDHRTVDGREAVGFLVRIKDAIENPERMMLEV